MEHVARHDGQSEDSLAWLVRLLLPATFGDFGTGAPRALSVHGLLERRCDALRRFLEGIVGEMGVARGGLGLGVAEDSPNHRQALAPHHLLRGKRVSEIVDTHIVEPGRLAHPPPRLLQIGQMRAFDGAGDDIGITLGLTLLPDPGPGGL